MGEPLSRCSRVGGPRYAAAARLEVEKLKEIEQTLEIPAGTYDWRTQVMIERQIAEAWLAKAEGRNEDAVRAMRAAAELDDAAEKHPVTPGASSVSC